MSYVIEYLPQDVKRYPMKKEMRPIKLKKWSIIVGLISAIIWMRLNGVPDFLIPGEPEQTRAAASAMIENLRDGAPLDKAVTAFCQDIIYGAQG